MITDYPDTLGTIVYHLDSHSIPFGIMRWNLYTGYYIPHSVHDGIYDAWPYTTYEAKFISQQSVTTDVTIDMTVWGANDTWNARTTVCVEPSGDGKTLKVWVVQALDNWGASYLDRNGAKAGNSGIDIILAPGECTTVDEVFVLDSDSLAAPNDVKFFAWAQDPVFVLDPDPTIPNGGYSWAEVYQGAKALAPFEGVFVDGFETGDESNWSVVTP